MPRDEMLERMTSRELTEWMAYARLEPFGGDIQFIGHAITSSTVANAQRRKGTKAYKPEDFVPKFDVKKGQTVEQQIQIAAMFTAAMGGEDKRERDEIPFSEYDEYPDGDFDVCPR